ncbi:MAG TPA: hypothetical protein VK174_08615 [Chitinophagales bacterium]|nr:hypothetical protein [Chitinophagales bacterium]
MKLLSTICALFFYSFSFCQQNNTAAVDFDVVDSLIETTPALDMCLKDGKEDLRFFSKTPEKYSDFKQKFMEQVSTAVNIPAGSHFYCDISAEINCEGKAGNYNFAFEPRTFTIDDFEILKQYITLVNAMRETVFTPAIYLGEKVNSKVRFKLLAKEGKVTMQ